MCAPQNAWPWDSSKLKLCLQSPINIQVSTAKKSEFPPLTINVPSDPNVEFTVKTKERGVICEVTDKNAKKLNLTGGFLPECYCFNDVHYHWGENNDLGSEHFINGESYAGEIHIVIYKKEYKDFNTALQNEDGIAVLTIFMQLGKKNEKFEKMLCKIQELSEKSCTRAIGTDLLFWFATELSENNATYLTYPGSLTTPPYTEIITFIILCHPIFVSEDQLQTFRSVVDDQMQPILCARREIQPLKDRPILCGGKLCWNIETSQC